MADTPDDLLAKARAGMGEWLDAEDRSDAEFEAAQRMYQGIYDLDRLLSSGAPLPSAWAQRKAGGPTISGAGRLVPPGAVTAELRYGSGAEWPTLAPRRQEEDTDAVTVEAVRHLNAADAEIARLRRDLEELGKAFEFTRSKWRAVCGHLAERDAQNARLTAELDGLRGTPVEHVTSEAALAAAMTADPGREDGALLRCTYGERKTYAWRAAAREWEQVT